MLLMMQHRVRTLLALKSEKVAIEDVDYIFSTKEVVLEDGGTLSLRIPVPK